MATIGRVSAKVSIDHVKFMTGMASMGQAVRSFTASASAGFGFVSGTLAALGITAGLQTFVSTISNLMMHYDRMLKFSVLIGTTAEEMNKLEYASRLARLTDDDLDTGLRRMLKTLGQATDGTKVAQLAFSRLGLDFRKLGMQDAVQTFKDIADAIAALDNPAQRSAATLAIFGRSGQNLLPLLRDGSKGIDALGKQAERMGLALNNVDSAKIEKANDSLTRVKGVVEGILAQLIIQFAPMIEKAADDFVSFGNSIGGWGNIAKLTFKAVAFSIAAIGDTILEVDRKILGGIADLIHGALEGVKYVLGLAKAVVGFKGDDVAAAGFQEMIDAIDGAQAASDSFLTGLADGLAQNITLTEALNEWFQSIENMDTDNAGMNKAPPAAIDSGSSANIIELIDKLQQQADEFGLVGAEIDIYRASMAGASQDQLDYMGKLAGTIDHLQRFKTVQDELSRLQTETRDQGLSKMEQELNKLRDMGAAEWQLAQAKELMWKQFSKQNYLDDLDKAASKIEGLKTPFEKYNDEILENRRLFNEGLLDAEQLKRAQNKAFDDMAATNNGEFSIQKSSLINVAALNPNQSLQEKANASLTSMDSKLGDIRDAVKSPATFGI